MHAYPSEYADVSGENELNEIKIAHSHAFRELSHSFLPLNRAFICMCDKNEVSSFLNAAQLFKQCDFARNFI